MTTTTTIDFNTYEIRKAGRVIRAIDHKFRQKILRILDEAGGQSVTFLYIILRCEQSVCSQHLAILRDVGLVLAERQGKLVYYSVNYEKIDLIKTVIAKLSE